MIVQIQLINWGLEATYRKFQDADIERAILAGINPMQQERYIRQEGQLIGKGICTRFFHRLRKWWQSLSDLDLPSLHIIVPDTYSEHSFLQLLWSIKKSLWIESQVKLVQERTQNTNELIHHWQFSRKGQLESQIDLWMSPEYTADTPIVFQATSYSCAHTSNILNPLYVNVENLEGIEGKKKITSAILNAVQDLEPLIQKALELGLTVNIEEASPSEQFNCIYHVNIFEKKQFLSL